MGKVANSNVSKEELLDAWQSMSGAHVDTIIAKKGSLAGVLTEMERALRSADSTGTAKSIQIENSLQLWDSKHSMKFSKAAKVSPETWAHQAKEEVRKHLQKENKRVCSQTKRDNDKAKQAGLPAGNAAEVRIFSRVPHVFSKPPVLSANVDTQLAAHLPPSAF
jgi:hypothetical protein